MPLNLVKLLEVYPSFLILCKKAIELDIKHVLGISFKPHRYYGKIRELQPILKASTNIDQLHKFVDLCIFDAVNAQMDSVFCVERKNFLEKQTSYTPIPYSDIFMKEKSVILISGIAGIGKTWLLRKCLLDWSNGLIWKNELELVFFIECRRLNQYQDISNIDELLSVFYKDIINDFSISSHTVLFIFDGLDEFIYVNELSNPKLNCNYPIVCALAEIQKYKHVVAGRVYAIDQYQNIYAEHSDKVTIQIMGFNENGINNYVENHVMEVKKEAVKAILNESAIAKAMATVPFYLSSMCKIIIENKVIFSKEENQAIIIDLNKNGSKFFGFIELIETDLGCYYQFAHLTIVEFCASVYAYNCLSSKEILANERLESCLPMICGLANKNQKSLLKFLVNLNASNNSHEDSSLLLSFFEDSKIFQEIQKLIVCTSTMPRVL
ncbi:NACHT, LRR and PYD domains-containing protein 3-like [Hydra vulgaris]|uniref:NACHT, LRR and PYD domains-containing protein 3-like n=1 Tax=Hydra vulgaris TaxID=6087 RepID=A0ABM4B0Y9_HYDVU